MNKDSLELKPFKSFDFYLNDFILAGCKITIRSEKEWNTIFVDGIKCNKAVFNRNVYVHNIELKNESKVVEL